jgi:CheY-like chemotaxis protein
MTPFSNGKFKVLVVDDDPSVLSTYCRLLRRAGYSCQTSDDPLQVLEQQGGLADVDLMLIDYKMPGMTGLALLAELRRQEIRARCILISAYLNDEVRQQAKNLGVDKILEKPVDVRGLREAISEVLPVAGSPRTRLGA